MMGHRKRGVDEKGGQSSGNCVTQRWGGSYECCQTGRCTYQSSVHQLKTSTALDFEQGSVTVKRQPVASQVQEEGLRYRRSGGRRAKSREQVLVCGLLLFRTSVVSSCA